MIADFQLTMCLSGAKSLAEIKGTKLVSQAG